MNINRPIILMCNCVVILVLIYSVNALENKRAGKYKALIKDFKRCKGKYPEEAVPTFEFTHEITARNDSTFSSGIINVKGDTRKYKAFYTCYSIINGKIVKRFEMSFSCNDFFGSMLMAFTTIPYNDKTCAMKKGTYPYEVDVDAIHHTLLPEWEYGNLMLKFEITNGKKTVICTQSVLSTIPAK